MNEATFRCPDELGWKPQVLCFTLLCLILVCFYETFFFFVVLQHLPIVPSDGPISTVRKVSPDLSPLFRSFCSCLLMFVY